MRRSATSLILIALTLIGSGNALSEQSAGARDNLCGLYKVSEGNRLIPVFKIDGTYYSVLSRGGFEIALEECPEGLEVSRTPPSGVVGTKIGFSQESNEIYISIMDQVREARDSSFVSGKKQSMTAISKPSWLRDVTAQQPARTHDDFLGWYEPVWCPLVRGQVRKEGGKYFLAYQLLQGAGETGSWTPHGKQYELTPLPDRLGFTMGPGPKDDLTLSLIYSGTRKRFELQVTSAAMKSHVSRMPLARTPPPSPKEGSVPLPPMHIGIPATDG